jgi:hypothetical protein
MRRRLALGAQESLGSRGAHGQQLALVFLAQLQMSPALQIGDKRGQIRHQAFSINMRRRFPGQEQRLLHLQAIHRQTRVLDGIRCCWWIIEQPNRRFASIPRHFHKVIQAQAHYFTRNGTHGCLPDGENVLGLALLEGEFFDCLRSLEKSIPSLSSPCHWSTISHEKSEPMRFSLPTAEGA